MSPILWSDNCPNAGLLTIPTGTCGNHCNNVAVSMTARMANLREIDGKNCEKKYKNKLKKKLELPIFLKFWDLKQILPNFNEF